MSTDDESSTQPLDIEKGWENPFPSEWPLHEKYEEVVSQGKDLIIIVDDKFADRGTGKTVLSLKLAQALDQTDEGLTHDKVTMLPEEVVNAYADLPLRSSIVLDEGEVGASNRNPMSHTNQSLREITSMGRVEEKYLIVNTPLRKFIDKDIQILAHVWISVVRKGLALMHWFEWETYSESLLKPKVQWLPFKDLTEGSQPVDPAIYNKITRDKRDRIRGDGEDHYIRRSEHKEELDRLERNLTKKLRDDYIRGVMKYLGDSDNVSQRKVAKAFDVSQTTVSQVLNDEDYYPDD